MQKGSPREAGQILIWIIVGALVIAVTGGAYYLGRSTPPKSSPAPTVTSQPTATPDTGPAPNGAGETANWKTYIIEPQNFSIKYPPNWEFKDASNTSPDERVGIVLFQNQSNKTSGQERINFVYYTTVAPDLGRNMGLVDPKDHITEPEFLDPNSSYWSRVTKVSTLEQATVGGKKAMKQISYSADESNPNHISLTYWIWLGDRIIELSLYYDDKSDKKEDLIKTFNQMVSTIEFL